MNTFEKISPLILQTLIWIPTRIFLKVVCRFRIEGLQNLKQLSPGVIFAANHTSHLDPIVLPAALPFLSRFMPMFYVSRETKFYEVPWFARFAYNETFFRAWGAHKAIVGVHDYKKSLSKHVHILNENKSLMIFPQGGISPKDKPAKGGLGYLYYKTQKPVVPVRVIRENGAVAVKFGTPFLPVDMKPEAFSENAEKCKDFAQKVTNKIFSIN